MQMSDNLVMWYCAADGSYGMCERRDIVIIPMHFITDAERGEIDSAESEGYDVASVLDKIHYRLIMEETNA